MIDDIVAQVNEETGNRRPVMLSVLTRAEKDAQAAPAVAPATESEGEASQCTKGTRISMQVTVC